jgi:hypothetical protein
MERHAGSSVTCHLHRSPRGFRVVGAQASLGRGLEDPGGGRLKWAVPGARTDTRVESEPRPRSNNRWYLAGPGFMLAPSLEGLQATKLWGAAHPHSHHPWRRVKRHEVLTLDHPSSG